MKIGSFLSTAPLCRAEYYGALLGLQGEKYEDGSICRISEDPLNNCVPNGASSNWLFRLADRSVTERPKLAKSQTNHQPIKIVPAGWVKAQRATRWISCLPGESPDSSKFRWSVLKNRWGHRKRLLSKRRGESSSQEARLTLSTTNVLHWRWCCRWKWEWNIQWEFLLLRYFSCEGTWDIGAFRCGD